MEIEFTYKHLGAEYQCAARFERSFGSPSSNGPHDSEWVPTGMDIIGPDGTDWALEARGVYVREFGSIEPISLYELICKQADIEAVENPSE